MKLCGGIRVGADTKENSYVLKIFPIYLGGSNAGHYRLLEHMVLKSWCNNNYKQKNFS